MDWIQIEIHFGFLTIFKKKIIFFLSWKDLPHYQVHVRHL